MPRIKMGTSIGNRRKKRAKVYEKKDSKKGTFPYKYAEKTGVTPSKTILVNEPISRGNLTGRLIASMDLDEMLEASRIADMGIRGEKIPVVTSSKVEKYIGEVMRLNKRTLTKPIAEKMQQDLTVQIVERNKKTINAVQAKRLYRTLMNEK